ncbi:MAG: hypothetical protein ACFE8U_18530 [Candidatus Hermodarchaeota archaeon]
MKINRARPKRKILKIYCFTPIAKPMNGSLPFSKITNLLKLSSTSYEYKNGKTIKSAIASTYFLKGLRGAVRHKIMEISQNLGLEVCHTTDKETDKHGNKLLPEGFHLLGSCKENGECIIHQLFGSKSNEGIISFWANPISNITEKTAIVKDKVQRVHISTENRISLTYDRRPAQDFKERYFSGNFKFEIDVTNCSLPQIGLLIEAIMNLEQYGRGFNSGYGKIEIKKFQLLERFVKRSPIWNDESFEIQEEMEESSLKQEVLDSLEAWKSVYNN